MQFDLTLSGVDNIEKSFDLLAKRLDQLDSKLIKLVTSAKGFASAVGNIGGGSTTSGGGTATSATGTSIHQTASYPGAVVTLRIPPVVSPNGSGGASTSAAITKAVSAGSGARSAAGAINLVGFLISNLENPVVAVTAAMAALAVATSTAIATVTTYSQFSGQAGGNERDAKSLAGIAGAAGKDLGDVAGDAHSRPGFARQLINQIDAYRRIKDPEAAARYARAVGLNGYENLHDIPEEQYQAAKSGRGYGFDPSTQSKADALQAGLNAGVTKFKNFWASALVNVADNATTIVHRILTAGPNAPGAMVTGPERAQQAANKQAEAADKMTEAADNMVYASRQGVIGATTERAGSAVPAVYAWYGYQQSNFYDSKRLGAFAR